MKFQLCDIDQSAVNLYPIGDWHYGSKQCLLRFVKKVIGIIDKDPEARWVSMGDLAENAIIGSKSDVYLQEKNPEDQFDDLVDLLKPIKDKCLFTIPGNHGQRTHRVAGLDPDRLIAKALGVPFHRYSVLASLMLRKLGPPNRVVAYFHHSRGGGSTQGGKINAASKLRLIAPNADATFAGHSHTTSRTPVTWYDAGYKSLLRKTGYDYIIGSALTWKESYAEEKTYRPAAVEQIMVRFERHKTNELKHFRQTYTIIQPD